MEASIYDELVLSHKDEKETLKVLEATEHYKIYNPVLIAQRDKVRKLKDRIIYIEEEKNYAPRIIDCKFTNCVAGGNKDCQDKVFNSVKTWVLYGNCCKSCNFIMNNRAEEIEKRRLTRAERNIMLTGYEL